MKRGDIVEIQPEPRYSRQWLVQGSGREPYKISLTKSSIFQCGCPAGRTTPGGMAADPCKHVMQVQIKFGYVGQIPQATVLQAEVTPTGRRFRD